MSKLAIVVFLFLLFNLGHSQEVSLPADMRQHTLTQYNASLFNPAFSLDRNNPESLSFWTRWQWQNVDADPTTLFLNYTRSLNENSVASVGFFQHNTGIYFNTGGALNYAYQIEFNRLIKLTVGANVFGFIQEFADTRFTFTPIPGITQTLPTNDFILQVAPGFNLEVENFSLSLASENLFDYNFADNQSNTATSDKIYMGMASYDFPVMASDSTAYIRPSIYLRTIPEQQNQIGFNALFSSNKFWAQSGYNNFYGISVGAGGTFLNRVSVGALVEFGTSSSINSKDPSFEILASYYLGKPTKRRPLVASGVIDNEQQLVVLGDELALQTEEVKEKELISEKATQQDSVGIQNQRSLDEDVLTDATLQKQTKEDKKEAKRLAAQLKEVKKQERKDSIATVKREKEALAIVKKQEEEQAKMLAERVKKEEERKVSLGEAQQQRKLDSLQDAKKAKVAEAQLRLKENQQSKANAAAERVNQQKVKDSIENIRKAEAIAAELKAKEEQRLDSISKANSKEDLTPTEVVATEVDFVAPEVGFKYQAMASEVGIDPGFYLVVNIFGTKKYFDLFMNDLNNKGLEPKSFYRELNSYNYVYLKRYSSIGEARKARDSKFNGKYADKMSIFSIGK